jgi:L-rhamnose mutarotase
MYSWSFPEIIPAILDPLTDSIAQSIASKGSTQCDMSERFGFEVEDLACHGSTQYDCAHRLILEEVKDRASFHSLCIRYGVYSFEPESEVYEVIWSDNKKDDQALAKKHAEDYTPQRWEYVNTWKQLAPLLSK